MKKLEISRKDLKSNIALIVKKANSYGRNDEGKRVKVIGVVKANGMGLRFSRIFKDAIKQWSYNACCSKCRRSRRFKTSKYIGKNFNAYSN